MRKVIKNNLPCFIDVKKKMEDNINLSEFLIENQFQLESWRRNAFERYRREITDYQTLYVKIDSDHNKIIDVEYESRPLSKFDEEGVISFETISDIRQLEHLIKALTVLD